MLEHLIPSRRALSGEEPSFALNAEVQRRRGAGEAILDATLGVLTDDQGQMVTHESVQELWRDLNPSEFASCAPLAGDPAFLKALVQRHWPKLESQGAACATAGGSGALALSLRNFLEPGMAVLTGRPYWGPYDLLAGENGIRVATAPFKVAGHPLDLESWARSAKALMGRQGRLMVWLNEPCQNPTGLSLSREDRQGLLEILSGQVEYGPVTLLLDLACVDYTADPGHVREALDQYAAFAEEGEVLVGAALSTSTSLTLYGARGGALAFPWCREPSMEAALGLACRGLGSASPRAPQSLLVRLARDGKRQAWLHAEQRHWSQVLESRAVALDVALRAEGLEGAPWHGGFSLTLRLEAPAAVAERLQAQGVFVAPLREGIRVGICGLRAMDAPRLASALRNAR